MHAVCVRTANSFLYVTLDELLDLDFSSLFSCFSLREESF